MVRDAGWPTTGPPGSASTDEVAEPCSPDGLSVEDMDMDKLEGICPTCQQGELITITMAVNGADLNFTTCHMCEAKWWYRDGEAVPLNSVIGDVITQRS
jgi:hypothetical protein